ncbi:cytosine permease [Palleronia sediminis]|uniref:Cytosine permease n=1 Tax=Palleronia sediminis TaxID=2547833 RepID=A0A4R6A3Y5_9RHOB|nr:cytosine permease [Palleronia sediminis]TDL78300.1 cytosine permease [Palleronia sediminis]
MASESEDNANTASGISVALIMLGIVLTPALLAAAGVGSSLAPGDIVPVVLTGGVILAVLSMITLTIGAVSRRTTYELVKFPFGRKGSVVINWVMAISLSGWIVVTSSSFAQSLAGLTDGTVLDLPAPVWVVIGTAIFVAATAFGFEALGKIARFAIPVAVVILAYIIFQVIGSDAELAAVDATMPFGVAVSSFVGTVMVLVTLSPDMGSFARNGNHARLAALLTFGVAYVLLFAAVAYPSALTGEGSLLGSTALLGGALAASLLLAFACFTSNAGNMFQGTLAYSALFPGIEQKWKITVGLGVATAIIAFFPILSYLVPFLLFLGIATPPVAGIYIADYFTHRKGGYRETALDNEADLKPIAFVAWLLGSATGLATVNGLFTLTLIPSLDSLLIASASYVVFGKLFGQNATASANSAK